MSPSGKQLRVSSASPDTCVQEITLVLARVGYRFSRRSGRPAVDAGVMPGREPRARRGGAA